MKISSRLLCLLLAGCCLVAGTARAELKDIYASNNSGEIEIGFKRQKYGESVNDATFNYEKGALFDFGFALNYMPHASRSSWFLKNLYMRLQGDFAFGDTDYVGGLCYANNVCVPHTTTTENNILNFSGRIGHGFPIGQQVMLIPYGDLGFRMWRRKITGVGGYTEDYQHGFFMAGMLAQYSPTEKWVLALGAEGGRTFAAEMTGLGRVFKLGARPIWQMEGRIGYRMTKHLELTAKGEFSGFGYGVSPVVSNYYEPDSYTHNLRTTVGLAYQFAP
ncbi:MAG: hypothetical protein WBK91_10565 [Alphaproteobacteria bacterium]